jgi:DNA repair ATPase RecN
VLSRISIRNYQSLYDVDLELAPLTVIVGPSNVGKSAFVRAVTMLCSNARGTSFISHGQQLTTITAVTDHGTIVLRRGAKPNDNEYVLVDGQSQRHFKKLGGEVPIEVSQFLGIDAKDPMNFAAQLDTPFLLSNSSSEVARVLGALTNVHVVFEGAREANRRKLGSAASLRVKSADLEQARERLESIRQLRQRREALELANKILETSRTTAKRLELLRRLTAEWAAEEGIRRTTPQITLTTVKAESMVVRLRALRSLLADLEKAAAGYRTANLVCQAATERINELHREHHDELTAAGTCPTCGQSTKELT